MSLNTTLEEIKKVQPLAEETIDETKFIETLNARRGRKAQAIQSLKRLKRDYRNKLRTTAAYILVVGDKRNEFVSTATESFGCFSDDPESFYKDLANRITKVSDVKRESNTALHDILGRHLEEKMGELDVTEYNQLLFNEKYRRTITKDEDFLTFIRTVINDRVGPEIVAINAVQNLTNKAISAGHKGSTTPILLPTGDDAFALEVINGLAKVSSRVFLVGAGKISKAIKAAGPSAYVKDPTNESVEQALKQISDSLKK